MRLLCLSACSNRLLRMEKRRRRRHSHLAAIMSTRIARTGRSTSKEGEAAALTMADSQGKNSEHRTCNAKPLLRWAGSKRQLLATLRPLIPSFTGKYIEPFAGSAVLFFSLKPDTAILGDLNSELMHFYRVATLHAVEVYEIASAYERSPETYYRLRDHFTPQSEVDRAARFFFLNRLCFNGIYRTNTQGHFNVPFGGTKVSAFPTLDCFLAACTVLERVSLINDDFEVTLSRASRGDFCFVDPPYYSDSSRVFAEYDNRPFSRADVDRLRNLIVSLDTKGVRFMVSYQEGEEAAVLGDGFNVESVTARRTIASSTKCRRSVQESIIRNYT